MSCNSIPASDKVQVFYATGLWRERDDKQCTPFTSIKLSCQDGAFPRAKNYPKDNPWQNLS